MLRMMCPLLAVGALSGCWMSKADGELLQTTAHARDQRLEQLESQARMNRQEIDGKVAELEEVLSRATLLLTRDSADVGAQVELLRGLLVRLRDTNHKEGAFALPVKLAEDPTMEAAVENSNPA